MSTQPAPANAQDKSIEAAEEAVWSVMGREVQRNDPQALLYLEYWLKAVPGAAQPAGKFKRVPFTVFQRLSDYSTRYNAETGEQMSWLFGALMADPGRRMKPEAGLAVATELAKPPPDAMLTMAQYEDHDGAPVFMARWMHRFNGVPVERDFIQVLVNGNTAKPFAMHRQWHTVEQKPRIR